MRPSRERGGLRSELRLGQDDKKMKTWNAAFGGSSKGHTGLQSPAINVTGSSAEGKSVLLVMEK